MESSWTSCLHRVYSMKFKILEDHEGSINREEWALQSSTTMRSVLGPSWQGSRSLARKDHAGTKGRHAWCPVQEEQPGELKVWKLSEMQFVKSWRNSRFWQLTEPYASRKRSQFELRLINIYINKSSQSESELLPLTIECVSNCTNEIPWIGCWWAPLVFMTSYLGNYQPMSWLSQQGTTIKSFSGNLRL